MVDTTPYRFPGSQSRLGLHQGCLSSITYFFTVKSSSTQNLTGSKNTLQKMGKTTGLFLLGVYLHASSASIAWAGNEHLLDNMPNRPPAIDPWQRAKQTQIEKEDLPPVNIDTE